MRFFTFTFLTLTLLPSLARGAGPQTAPATLPIDSKTDATIQGALKYLRSQQAADGSWGDKDAPHPIAITAYALTAFLAAGGQHDFARTALRAVEFLANSEQPDGVFKSDASRGQYMYDHGIATFALAEVYGIAHAPNLRPKLQAAVQLLLAAQNPQGGWRYSIHPTDADVCITALELVALQGAKNSGIDVPQAAIDNGVKFIQSCYDLSSGGFGYMPHMQPGFARTAGAIYSLQVCGRSDDPMLVKASAYLRNKVKADAETGKVEMWFTYGSFYAAPAEYMVGGDAWKDYCVNVSQKLVDSVKHDREYCYWEPLDYKVGPVYATAVYTMVLATPYHRILHPGPDSANAKPQ